MGDSCEETLKGLVSGAKREANSATRAARGLIFGGGGGLGSASLRLGWVQGAWGPAPEEGTWGPAPHTAGGVSRVPWDQAPSLPNVNSAPLVCTTCAICVSLKKVPFLVQR